MKINTVIISMLFALSLNINAQIPNNGFENWFNTISYEDPTGWATMNAACTGPFYSCTKSTDHFPLTVGNYSIRVENNTSLTQMTGGYGMAITNAFDWPFKPAFPIIGHPLSLCGYYKFNSINNDTMFIRIVMFDNGSQVFSETFSSGGTSSWNSFTIPFPSYANADSATIMISAFTPASQVSGPNGNSVLYVDNLSFDQLISSVDESGNSNPHFNIFPNPADDFLVINSSENMQAVYKIFDMKGAMLKSGRVSPGSSQINTGNLKSGLYFIEIYSESVSFTKKIMINR